MNFVMEQYEALDLDSWEIGIPDLTNDKILELFNRLPSRIQGLAVAWGAMDSVFRDEAYLELKELFKNDPHILLGD